MSLSFTKTAKLCGFIRSLLNLYLIPFLILGLAYLQLIEMIETVFEGIQESMNNVTPISNSNDNVAVDTSTITNINTDDVGGRLVNKNNCSLAVLLFGSFINMISIAPAIVATFMSYSSPSNAKLMQAYICLWNYWETMLFFNVVFIGLCSMILSLKAFIIKNKSNIFLARLMNHVAFVLAFQFYGWIRFIIIVLDFVAGYPINQVSNTNENGAMYMFNALLACTLFYVTAILISNSAIFSSGIYRLAKRWTTCPPVAESEEDNELIIPSTAA